MPEDIGRTADPERSEGTTDNAEIREVIRASKENEGLGKDVDSLPPAIEDRRKLQKGYAIGLFVVMAIQLAIADLVFAVYVVFGEKLGVDPGAMQAWLAATVVQVIGLVYAITRSLFPRRDAQD